MAVHPSPAKVADYRFSEGMEILCDHKNLKTAEKQLGCPPVRPSGRNITYSTGAVANIGRGNTAHPYQQRAAKSRVGLSTRIVRKSFTLSDPGSHDSALNSLIPDFHLLRASEISESCCLGNLWRQLLNFRKIQRF